MSNGPGHASPWINRGAGRSGWDYFFVPSPKAAAAKGKFESPRNQLWCQIVMTSASSPIFFPFARTCEYTQGFPEGSVVKNLPAVPENRFNPWVRKMPWRRKWQSHSSILAWETPWMEKPGGYSSWGHNSFTQHRD